MDVPSFSSSVFMVAYNVEFSTYIKSNDILRLKQAPKNQWSMVEP